MWISLTQQIYGGWATRGPISHYITIFISSTLPALRILLGLYILWTISGITKTRQLTAYNTAILCAFLTYGYLNPMFFNTGNANNVSAVTGVHGTGLTTSEGGTHLGPSHADIDVSHVALFILSVSSAFVGLALGSLLPRPLAGVTLGCGGALLVTALVPHWIMSSMGGGSLGLFTVLGPVMSLVGGVLTTR